MATTSIGILQGYCSILKVQYFIIYECSIVQKIVQIHQNKEIWKQVKIFYKSNPSNVVLRFD